MRSIHLLACLGILGISSCGDSSNAGTNDETMVGTNDETFSKGMFFRAGGGQPAAGAKVQVFPRDQVAEVVVGSTDALGRPVLAPVADGEYSVKVSDSGEVVILDRVVAQAGTLRFARPDTLELPGSLSGEVRVQPQDDPATVTVNILGSDLWANVSTDGKFHLEGVSQGTYRLRFSITLPDYSTTFATVIYQQPVGVGRDVVIPDPIQMVYTGIPVVTGLTARIDSTDGLPVLSWSPVNYRNFDGFLVYRDSFGAVEPSTRPIALTTDTSWKDLAAIPDLAPATWTYRIVVRNRSLKSGQSFESVEVTARPRELSQLDQGVWTRLGGWHGGSLGRIGEWLAEVAPSTQGSVLRVSVYRSRNGQLWDSTGVSLPLRRLGQQMEWKCGIGGGSAWCLGHSSIGDGVDVWSSADGASWTHATLPDSLWPLGASEGRLLGSPRRLALVTSGGIGLVHDSIWRLEAIPSGVVGISDSLLVAQGGGGQLLLLPLDHPFQVDRDLGLLPGLISPVFGVVRNSLVSVLGGERLWVLQPEGWFARGEQGLRSMADAGDRLLVADKGGWIWAYESSK